MKKESQYERYGNYIINRGQSLGSGTFGKVYKGYRVLSQNCFGNNEHLRLEPVAIKQSFCEASNLQEINILKILNHPNIIEYIDYKIHGNSLLMVMELCEQGTLQDLLLELPNDQCLNDKLLLYYGQIVSGIKFIYEKNILHRDIKPSNILIKDNKIKIADFGTSKLYEQQQLRTLVGTPLFSSPELLKIAEPAEEEIDEPIKSTYTQKSDIWSLGLVLYMMFNYQKNYEQQGQRLRKSLPWTGKHAGQVLKNIYQQPLSFKNEKIPVRIKTIIERMLEINPSSRMSFKDLFALQQFQDQSLKSLALALSSQNLALSKSFLSDSEIGDQVYLDQGKEGQKECKAEQVQKKQINWELLKLLQIKDSEHYEDEQIKQAIEFYTLLFSQLNQVKAQSCKYENELLFLLQKKLFELQSWRLWNIEYQLQKQEDQNSVLRLSQQKQQNKSLNTIMHIDKHSISQVLEQIKGHHSMVEARLNQLKSTLNEQKFTSLIEKPESQKLISKQKIIVNFLKPDSQLLSKLKQYVKRQFVNQLTAPLIQTSIKCNMNLTHQLLLKRKKIHFIYDLFIAIQFQYSWKLKAKLSANYRKQYDIGYMKDGFFQKYCSIRRTVSIKQIIKRINQSYSYLKISGIKVE